MKVDHFGDGRHVNREGILPSGPEKFSTLFFEVFMNMKMIAAACVAFCSLGANAATVVASCKNELATTDAMHLLKSCAPEVTFYAPGATALKGAIQSVLTTDQKVFDKTKPFVSITRDGDSNAYAYYGFGASGKSYAGKRLAVIVNGTNGSMAGVNQLLSGLKNGSYEAGVDQKEYITIKLHGAKEQAAGTSMPDADVKTTTVYDGTTVNGKKVATVVLVNGRKESFKTGWGLDKQAVAHMAFSDVRPSEATPLQIKSWDPKAFPTETIAMQGFGVVVNNNMYKALMARDVAAGRITDANCDSSNASILLAKCQPTVFTSDMTALITGKTTSAADFLQYKEGQTTVATYKDMVLNLSRRPNSSGTQAATQIRFAAQANYIGKTPLAKGFDMAGADGATFDLNGVASTTTDAVNAGFNVFTNSGTGDLIKKVQGDNDNLSIGVASLDNKAASKFGASNGTAASRDLETARWVKVDGKSPNFKGDGSVDSNQRAGLQAGYDFAFEFQTLKSAKLAGVYLDIYKDIVDGLKDPLGNLTGIGYIASTDATKNTAWTRGGNNFFPLNKY